MAASAPSLEYVQKMFLAYFGRPVAPTGQEYYGQVVDAGNIAALQDDFWNSAESQATFGNLPTEARVNAIFQQLFGRDAAVAGLTYWTTEINAGRVSLPQAALTILNSAAAADLAVFNAKLEVANAFTGALDSTEEILAYQNNTNGGRSLLTGIKSQADADTTVAGIDTAVNNVVSGGTSNPGQTYTLTVNADNFVGTAGNDTINAGLTGAGATIQPIDSIDGGAGIDTLNTTASTNGDILGGALVKNVENINVRVTSGTAATLDASSAAGLTNINANLGAGTLVATNLAKGAAVSVTGDGNVANGEVASRTLPLPML